MEENSADVSHVKTAGRELIACHECDFIHVIKPLSKGGKALCTRCGALLYQSTPNSIEKALALNLAAFMLFVMANAFPFLSLEIGGRFVENYFLSGALMLYRLGMGEVGLLVLITSFLFPLFTISGMLYILLPIKLGYRPWKMSLVYRMVRAIKPWSLVSVFMLGVLISFVKLLDLATIIPGISLFSFVGLMVVMAAAHVSLDPFALWNPTEFGEQTRKLETYESKMPDSGASVSTDLETANRGATARAQGLICCHTCALLVPEMSSQGHCPRCKTLVHSRKTNSIERTWALIFSAVLLFIPANIYPVMTVIQFGQVYPSTILGGVVHLIDGGMWVLGLIIFFASIIVPVLKLIVLSCLLISIQRKTPWRTRDRTLLFRVTEVIGAWSMVDIYVVAILAGLVNLGALSSIRPGIGVVFFGGVVVITMFAASSFDPRLIWDNSGRLT